jgi:hypothetical protein
MCAGNMERFRGEFIEQIERHAQVNGLYVWFLSHFSGSETISLDTAPYGPDTPQDEQIGIAITPFGLGYSILQSGWEWVSVNFANVDSAQEIADLIFAEYERLGRFRQQASMKSGRTDVVSSTHC